MAFADRKVALIRRPLGRRTWEDLRPAILEFALEVAGWKHDSPVIAYEESLYRCELRQVTASGWTPPRIPFEGRLFDSRCELRWVAHEDRSFEAWGIAEAAEPIGEPAWREDRRYYLLGTGTAVSGEFRDARYGPNKVFSYPVEEFTEPPLIGSDKREVPESIRAYVLVAEYYRDLRAWEGLSDDMLGSALDDPMLLAHRFVAVKAGRTIDG